MRLENYVKEVGIATDFPKFNGKECICTNLTATDLFLAQYYNGYFNAVDIVVKYMAIENYYGKNDYGFALYRKMQSKRVNEDWSERYRMLIKSFENGIDITSYLEVDLNYSIHDGAHRLALALYHNIDEVPTKIFNVEACRRAYGMDWFEKNDFTEDEVHLIRTKLHDLLEMARKPYFCILWTPARQQFNAIESAIGNVEMGVQIEEEISLALKHDELEKFIYDVYETDDIMKYKLDLKFEHIMSSLSADHYADENYELRIIKLKIDNPDFRLKPLSGLPQSRTTMRLKKKIREMFSEKITEYYYDIIMHLTDNQIQNDAVSEIIRNVMNEHEL